MFYRPGNNEDPDQLIFTAGNIGTTTAGRWMFLGGSGSAVTGANGPSIPILRAGTIKNMAIWWMTAGTADPETVTFTVYVNGVATVVVGTRAVTASGVDLVDTPGVAVVPGDVVAVRVTRSGALTLSPDTITVVVGFYT